MTTISITSYREICECDHCGRSLRHGIVLSDGRTVGATCFDKKLTAPKVNGAKAYRVGSEHIVKVAKVVARVPAERWGTYGVGPASAEFILA